MEPRQVVLRVESLLIGGLAPRRRGATPVVGVQSEGRLGGALVGGVVGAGIGPFAQAGLDEALGFALVLGV